MTEHTSTPELRFPEFKEEWREFNLKDISTKKSKKNKNKLYNETFTNSAEYGIVPQKDYFDKEISNVRNLSNYYIVDPDDFVYNPRISSLAPVGPINRNKLNRIGVMSPLYTVFSTKLSIKSFLEYYFKTTKWHKFMKLNGDSGARSDRFTIKQSLFVKMPIVLPSEQEQEKIGGFFSKLDRQIELEEKKLELLEQQKKGYMQKIFSQELRFKDKKDNYYSDWKNCQLKDLTYYKNGKGYEKVATTNGKYNIINLNSIGIKGQLKNSGKYTDFEDDTLLKNDLIMILSDVAKGNLIGMTAIIDENNKYLLNQRIALLRIKNSLITNAYFLYLYINFNRKYFINMSAGMSQLNINKKTVEDFPVNLPNIEEQNKIAILFKNYGDTIKKQASKVKLLKQRKQGLLQKMFV
mgnify:FL=1